MDLPIRVFIASDVHGKFDELWCYVLKQGFIPNNKHHLLILNGDIIDCYAPQQIIMQDVLAIKQCMDQHSNIILIKGNHEACVKLSDDNLQTFLDKLPVVFKNDNLFVCHGWYNPYWSIAQHKDKMTNDEWPVANYGQIYHGSPQNIIVREQMHLDYFGFKSFKQYEQALIDVYPNQTFIFGHYFSFLWMYEKCIHMHYFIYRDELIKLRQGLPNLISTMAQEFNYSQPYISPTKKIYCIDVFTKCYKNNLPYYFYVYKTNSKQYGQVFDEDGNGTKVNIK